MPRYSLLWAVVLVATGCARSGLDARGPQIQVADPGTPPIDPDVTPAPVEPSENETDDPPPPPPDPPEDPEEEEEEPTQPPPPVDPPDPPPPPQNGNEACYPGPGATWDVCLAVAEYTNLGSDYAYPAPLNGSAQYRAPVKFIDLDVADPNTMIAENFRLDEIAQRYKGRYAVVQPHAIDRLQDVRDDLGGLVINSGYRPPGYNASVGGASSSRHMYGDGFDIDPVSASLTTLQNTCYAHGAGYVGVYATHIHCDWRNDTMAVEFFGSAAGTFAFVPPEFDASVRFDGFELDAPAEGWDEGEPLREWTAYDAQGYAIDTATGEKYEPPADAASVEVWIGREIVRTVHF